MSDFRRAYVPGGSFFFTLVTERRAPIFRAETARACLGTAGQGGQTAPSFAHAESSKSVGKQKASPELCRRDACPPFPKSNPICCHWVFLAFASPWACSFWSFTESKNAPISSMRGGRLKSSTWAGSKGSSEPVRLASYEISSMSRWRPASSIQPCWRRGPTWHVPAILLN